MASFLISIFLLCCAACFACFGAAEARASPFIPISSLITKQLFNTIFLHKDDAACPAKQFYTYESFIQATRRFPAFGRTGCISTRKREIGAFLAQISHETTGGWSTAPDGPYAWGLCYKEEISPQSNYCDSSDTQWPCYPGKSYFGRGPIQLSWYNYISTLIHQIILCINSLLYKL